MVKGGIFITLVLADKQGGKVGIPRASYGTFTYPITISSPLLAMSAKASDSGQFIIIRSVSTTQAAVISRGMDGAWYSDSAYILVIGM